MVPVFSAIHGASIDEALSSVRSGRAGLSSVEAARRLAEYGPNRIHKGELEAPIIRLAREFFRFFSVVLWIAAALAFVAQWAERGEGGVGGGGYSYFLRWLCRGGVCFF